MPDGEFMWDGDLAGEQRGEQRGEMLVELILPRDWYDDPDAAFPSLYGLNGLYGSEYSSAWLQENRGDNLKWETFLTEELPGLLARDWRTNMRTQGSYDWMSWKKDMEAAWPVIVEALNVDQ